MSKHVLTWSAAVALLLLVVGLLSFGCGGGEESESAVGAPEATPEARIQEVRKEAAAAGGEMLVVPKVRVGGAMFGMTLDEVRQLWGEPEEGGDNWCSYFSKGVTLETLRPSSVIYKATCHSKQWGMPDAGKFADFEGKTAEGIGIGSTEEEVVRVYGEPTRRESEGKALRYEPMGMVFFLKDGKVVGMWVVGDMDVVKKRQKELGG